MLTTMTIYRAGEDPVVVEEDWPAQPSYRFLVEKLAGTLGAFERVNVFWQGGYTDMFVDAVSVQKGLPRNDVATSIYRNNVLQHERPRPKPETLPAIYGPAVLISRKVWF